MTGAEVTRAGGDCILGYYCFFRQPPHCHIPPFSCTSDASIAACWEPAASATAQQAGGGGTALVGRLRLECRVTGPAAVLLTPDVLRQFSSILTALLQVRQLYVRR